MKKVALSIVILLLLITMVSCGGNKENATAPEIEDPITLKMSIVLDEGIKDDGYKEIKDVEFKANKGMTILEATKLFCVSKDIDLEVDPKGVYITHLNGLTEKDFSEMTGWSFTVNGELGTLSAAEQVANDGDNIEWKFLDFSSISW